MKKSIVMSLVNSYVNKGNAFIIILNNGDKSQPLNFLEEDSECIVVETVSNGLPAAYNFDDINNLVPFITDSQETTNNTNSSKNEICIREKETLERKQSDFWNKEYETARFAVAEKNLNFVNRRDDIKRNVKGTVISKYWASIDSSFNDAKKNHSLSEKCPSIIKKISSLIETYNCSELQITLGTILFEMKDYTKATISFADGGDYYNAACCSKLCNDNKNTLLYLANYFYNSKKYDSSIISTFFFLAEKENSLYLVNFAMSDINFDDLDESCIDMIYYGLLYTVHGYDKLFDSLGETYSSHLKDIKKILKLLNKIDFEINPELKLSFVPSISEINIKQEKEEVSNAETIEFYDGNIIKFSLNDIGNNASGFINSKELKETIYFNIRQVESDELRSMLWNELALNAKVKFTLGRGFEGKAADHIIASAEISYVNDVYEGMVSSYGEYDDYGNRYGRIVYNNKEFFFREEAIVDPILKVYFEQSFNIENVYVKFRIKEKKAVSKVWLDYLEEKQIINDYSSYVDNDKLEKFLEERYKLENQTITACPFRYESLEPWNDDEYLKSEFDESNFAELENSVIDNVATSNLKLSNRHIYLGINELLSKGQTYLTKTKEFEKAEKCFLDVLDKNPESSHINTAVNNLISIYMMTERLDLALEILNKYKYAFIPEKYNNSLIRILDKSKRYAELAELLEKIIPLEHKNNTKADRIRKLIYCYIKTENTDAAINNLKKYKSDIDELSYNNYYLDALTIIGDFNKSEDFLQKLILNTYKTEYKLNYMYRLGILYQKNEKIEKSIDIYEQWKKSYSANRSHITSSTALSATSKIENNVDRNLSVLYYTSGDMETAKEIAKNLLRKNSNDSIAQQILDETYEVDASHIKLNDDIGDEYSDFEIIDDSIPKLVEWMLNNVDYEKQFYNEEILKNINNSKYIGDARSAKIDIEKIISTIDKRPLLEQSAVWLALAKIIKQMIESGLKDGLKDSELTTKKMNMYFGNSLLLKGDASIQDMVQHRDCSRYYYFISLRYLSRSGDIQSLNRAFNTLYYSFFLSDNDMAKITKDKNFGKKLRVTPPEYQDSVISVKELIILTFNLATYYSQSSLVGIIHDTIASIFFNDELKKMFIDNFKSILSETQIICQNKDDFYHVWQKARRKHREMMKTLNSHIGNALKYTNESEKLHISLDKIQQLDLDMILIKTDCEYIKETIKVLDKCYKFNELTIFDDQEDMLLEIIGNCEKIERDIHDTPTNFSYEKLLDSIVKLRGIASEKLNTLYKESKPNIKVSCKDTVYYKNDKNQAIFTFSIKNDGNLQRVDISNIQVRGVDNNVKIIGNPEHSISSVRGNSKEEYTVNLAFSETEKKRQSFDINISFDYSYYKGIDESVKETYSEISPINLSTLDSFVKIDNKYDRYCDSGAVDSDEMFYGREEDIEKIVKSLDQGDGNVLSHRGIYIYGQKRAGKSSIMAHLERNIIERYPNKYLIVDIGSIGSISEKGTYEIKLKTTLIDRLEEILEETFPNIYDEISDNMNFREVTKRIEDYPDTMDFDKLLRMIEQALPDKVIMIFVDEFTYIYEGIQKGLCSQNFPHFWKSLLQNHRICSIIVGQDNMLNFVEDIRYKNDFACMSPFPVSYLGIEGAKKLIYEPILDNGQKRFEDEALDYIYKLTAGSAYLIMIICSQLVDYMNERGTSRITKTTIETFVKKWLLNVSENSNAINDFHFDAQLNDPCFYENSLAIQKDNKVILTYISKNCNNNLQIKISDINCVSSLSEKTIEHQEKLINQLVRRKVLIREGEYCRILVDLLRVYLRND